MKGQTKGVDQKALIIGAVALLLGLIVIYYWRQDAQFKRCYGLLQMAKSTETIKKFGEGPCGEVLRNTLLK